MTIPKKTEENPLEALFLDELADIYFAENQLVKALPKMAKAARHADLRHAYESHLEQTEGHVQKLKEVFGAFGTPVKSKKCEAILGLLKEANELAAENKGKVTLDAALISAAQKVEHYEIASYGSLREWAAVLGNGPAADLIEEILDEEKKADETLTELARAHCNLEAAEENGAAVVASPGSRTRGSQERRPAASSRTGRA